MQAKRLGPQLKSPEWVTDDLKNDYLRVRTQYGSQKARKAFLEKYGHIQCALCVDKGIPCKAKPYGFQCDGCPRHIQCTRYPILERLRIMEGLNISADQYFWLRRWYKSEFGIPTKSKHSVRYYAKSKAHAKETNEECSSDEGELDENPNNANANSFPSFSSREIEETSAQCALDTENVQAPETCTGSHGVLPHITMDRALPSHSKETPLPPVVNFTLPEQNLHKAFINVDIPWLPNHVPVQHSNRMKKSTELRQTVVRSEPKQPSDYFASLPVHPPETFTNNPTRLHVAENPKANSGADDHSSMLPLTTGLPSYHQPVARRPMNLSHFHSLLSAAQEHETVPGVSANEDFHFPEENYDRYMVGNTHQTFQRTREFFTESDADSSTEFASASIPNSGTLYDQFQHDTTMLDDCSNQRHFDSSYPWLQMNNNFRHEFGTTVYREHCGSNFYPNKSDTTMYGYGTEPEPGHYSYNLNGSGHGTATGWYH
ncbi:hypothetical protein GYMLUDRAFT_65329 [Collybiopsis luxurians FD-317 M1]|uniref:Uncharacterized protein n=1 Tax=Collybiopsis luxurians FD-317 M1 TaxID=944289 RepID=A0A0D0AJC8_9AGAR|nr:hypothetical protein GYMLUDRAFT_65329 [Collybiopsis luxurians FD-317 M1]